MNLSKQYLAKIATGGSELPASDIFMLPEKILQFGTGVLLRALPDYFVDRANRRGIFNGRILVVKSTRSGDTDAFTRQDGVYTLCVRGLESGMVIDEPVICSAISRVLSASDEWPEILASAASAEMEIVISNTTEVGIRLVEESIFQSPPVSFPAKLLAFLYERFKIFSGSAESGMIIIPTELVTDNGQKLKEILIRLSLWNSLDSSFIEWLGIHNRFCSSLVDRIVPGKPSPEVKIAMERSWGYTDDLLVVCEVYRLWAIEGDEEVRNKLSFYAADEGVVITPDITKYKELKLRMLNASHSLSCGLAFLSGFETVRSAMENTVFENYLRNLMLDEIGRAIPFTLTEKEISEFGNKVLDRFRNPYLQHLWLGITMQYSTKLAMRAVPVLKKYIEEFKKPPELISLGFAVYILFMRAVKKEAGKFYGNYNNQDYLINDDQAAYFFNLWHEKSPGEIVLTVLANQSIWLTNLNQLEGFSEAVSKKLNQVIREGALQVLNGL